ncbi:MAG: hypothetical protein DRN66_03710 [Candidatus Nanohalarchaeota archaeon]|nr:MAG: hypothetical protein DRN66_03710 [Candidatus Nanohaloarchaeota archaeon]
MELKINRMRLKHKNVLVQAYYSPQIKINKAILFAYGLPGTPLNKNDYMVKKFIENNFIVLCPQYMGTYDSNGDFTLQNCVNSIGAAIDLVDGGKINDLNFLAEETILCGGSFGASIVLLCASKEEKIKKVIPIATPLKWSQEALKEHSCFIENLWSYTHRISKEGFRTLLEMDIEKAFDNLKSKNLFLIHGKNDKIVDVENSVAIYDSLKNNGKNELLLTEDEHIGCSALNNKKIFDKVIEWIKKK